MDSAAQGSCGPLSFHASVRYTVVGPVLGTRNWGLAGRWRLPCREQYPVCYPTYTSLYSDFTNVNVMRLVMASVYLSYCTVSRVHLDNSAPQ